MQVLLRVMGNRYIGAFNNQLRGKPMHVVRMYHIRAGCGDPYVAGDVDHRVTL